MVSVSHASKKGSQSSDEKSILGEDNMSLESDNLDEALVLREALILAARAEIETHGIELTNEDSHKAKGVEPETSMVVSIHSSPIKK